MVEKEAGEPQNPPYPQQRTPEQHAAVRRRALPIGIAGALCSIGGLILLLATTIDATHPPNLLGVNLAFCGLMMGIGILFYARGTPGTRLAALICMLALLTGLAGSLIYTRQTVTWRQATEGGELSNLHTIAVAARQYARDHDGQYPPSLEVLLDQKLLRPADLHSPFDSEATAAKRKELAEGKLSPADFNTWYARASDYDYFAQDLRVPGGAPGAPSTTRAAAGAAPSDLPPAIIIAASKSPLMRTNLGLAWADGRAELITLDQTEAALQACNEARLNLGLPPLQPPEAVARARAAETQP